MLPHHSPLLVGICGNAGVGKDTFASQFHFYGFKQYAFAGPVKEVCEKAFHIGPNYFDDRHLKEELHPFWNISPREMSQRVGTELFRKQFGDDFWIRRLQLQLMFDFDSSAEVKAVISDVRFQNEAQWILDSGGVLVHLTRPEHTGSVGIPGHASEAGIQFGQLVTTGRKTRIFTVANDGNKFDLVNKSTQFLEGLVATQQSQQLMYP